MKVYVAGQLADTAAVTAARQQILAAGHTLTHDWTQDPCFTEKYASRPEESADIARTDSRVSWPLTLSWSSHRAPILGEDCSWS